MATECNKYSQQQPRYVTYIWCSQLYSLLVTNHVSMVWNVNGYCGVTVHSTCYAITMLNVLYFYISICRNMCPVPSMAVFGSILISCVPGILLRYFVKHFEMAPVAPVITGIAFVFKFHKRCIYKVLLLLLLLLLLLYNRHRRHCSPTYE